jgi:lysosomal acid lipase/cholesteryl ester hydrolase
MSPEIIFLFFGRKIMLSFVPFWQRIFSPQTFVYFLDTSMKWIFGWHCDNIRFEDKVVYYQHLFSFTSVKQIVVNNETCLFFCLIFLFTFSIGFKL